MIRVVQYSDGTTSYELISPNCGREFCFRRDKIEAVIKRVEEWAENDL